MKYWISRSGNARTERMNLRTTTNFKKQINDLRISATETDTDVLHRVILIAWDEWNAKQLKLFPAKKTNKKK